MYKLLQRNALPRTIRHGAAESAAVAAVIFSAQAGKEAEA
jgi:hypothetical protein